jgi:4-hydroxy-tetrahydrodipicolinate reductase
MGRAVTALADKSRSAEIVAGVDAASPRPANFPTFSHITECDMPADVIVDFSMAQAVPGVISYAVEKRRAAVICTTGLDRPCEEAIMAASEKIPVFKSANMSIGVSLLANILKRISKTLYDDGFDIEVTEAHHRLKIDAPSGTALMFADIINGAAGPLEIVTDRAPRRERRPRAEIGVHSLRGGTIVGEHSVLFAGPDETIELRHRAASKEVFAAGALKAAVFIAGKPPGLYDMESIMDQL